MLQDPFSLQKARNRRESLVLQDGRVTDNFLLAEQIFTSLEFCDEILILVLQRTEP